MVRGDRELDDSYDGNLPYSMRCLYLLDSSSLKFRLVKNKAATPILQLTERLLQLSLGTGRKAPPHNNDDVRRRAETI